MTIRKEPGAPKRARLEKRSTLASRVALRCGASGFTTPQQGLNGLRPRSAYECDRDDEGGCCTGTVAPSVPACGPACGVTGCGAGCVPGDCDPFGLRPNRL